MDYFREMSKLTFVIERHEHPPCRDDLDPREKFSRHFSPAAASGVISRHLGPVKAAIKQEKTNLGKK